MGTPFILLALALVACASGSAVRIRPVDERGREVRRYTGVLYTNTRHVELRPRLRAVVEGDALVQAVCSVRLRPAGARPPLRSRLNPGLGTADLLVDAAAFEAAAANGTLPKFYEFDVIFADCESPAHVSRPVPVLLHLDTFELPKFERSRYAADAPAGAAVGTEILRIRATEASASVCKFAIEPPDDSPFDIDGAGVIRAKVPLPPQPRQYDLVVSATDCEVPVQRSATVHVLVRVLPPAANGTAAADAADAADATTQEICEAEWHGIATQFEAMSSGLTYFAPRAALSECRFERRRCRQAEAEVKVTVLPINGSAGCDLDSSSQRRLQEACGVDKDSVNLLYPQQHHNHQQHHHQQQQQQQCSAGQAPVSFNGHSTVLTIPDTVVSSQHLLGEEFTLHFWLQHGDMPTHEKEQIVCISDRRHHSRHHFSLFLHNCKLLLQLRQEPVARGNEERAAPAEWRFPLAQVCDSRWHHYSLTYSSGSVRLLVDGRRVQRRPEELDDLPLVPDSKNNGTVLTVGACWHGRDLANRQLLRGRLAALTLLPQRAEPQAVLRCLVHCSDRLQVRTRDPLPAGATFAFNEDSTSLVMRADTADDAARMLRRVAFVAAGAEPRPAVLRLDTRVQCQDPKAQLQVAAARVSVTAAGGSLCLSGHNLQRVTVAAVSTPNGVPLLSDLELRPGQRLVRGCSLRTAPELTSVESLSWPAGDGADVGVHGRATPRQLLLAGEATAAQYQRLLRAVRYFNEVPILRYRSFAVSCEPADGGPPSRQLLVKLSIFRPTAAQPPESANATKLRMQALQQRADEEISDGVGVGHLAKSSGASLAAASLHHDAAGGGSSTSLALPVVVGVVAAVALLLAAAALAIRRFRARRLLPLLQHQQQHLQKQQLPAGRSLPVDAELQQEMEWDNAGLNITVNPLDGQESAAEVSGAEDSAG